MSCQFKNNCKHYTAECEVRLLLTCPHFHTHQLKTFTNRFQDTFMCSLHKPKLLDKVLSKGGVPVYAYTPQALYNAILTEFRDGSKYSYLFKPVGDIVSMAMDGALVSESVFIVSAEHRVMSEAFVTPLQEAAVWYAQQNSLYILLPRGFIPPPNWKQAPLA